MDTELNESLLKKLDSEKDIIESPTGEPQSSLSKSLDDILKSMQRINQRLKDLSIERRAQVSQMLSATINEFKSSSKTNVKPNRFWQRTYFADEDLDELFKRVMTYSSVLFTYLNNLNDKVHCKSDTELDSVATPRIPKPEIPVESPRESIAALAVDLPQKVIKTIETACGDGEDHENVSDLQSIQQSFTDLITAKVKYDSQFLKFNAVISKTSYSEDFHCLCEICAKCDMILKQTSLSIDKRESLPVDKSRLRRKRRSINNDKGQSHLEKQLRRSKRLADIADEVQIIRSLKRIK